MIKQIRKRPFVRLLFLFLTGILLEYYTPAIVRYAWWLLPVAAIGMGSFRWRSVRSHYGWRWLWGAGWSALVLFLSIQLTAYAWRGQQWELASGKVRIEGVVEDVVTEKARTYSSVVRVCTYYRNDSVCPVHKRVRLYFQKDSLSAKLRPGDRILAYADFEPVTGVEGNQNYLRYLQIHGISATAFVSGKDWRLFSGTPSLSLPARCLKIRERLLQTLDGLELQPIENAVLSALVLGHTAALTPEVRQQFALAGVSHILAVSGFHVGVLCLFVGWLLSFAPDGTRARVAKNIIAFVAVWGFVAITGLSVPAVRAALMFSFYLIVRWVRRESDGYNILAAAAFFMLLYNPFYLFDVGFQLSFAAVFSLLWIQPLFGRLLAIENPLLRLPWTWMSVSLAAQIGTFPLCLYHFGLVSTVFLFTNLGLSALSALLIPSVWIWMTVEELTGHGAFLQIVPKCLLQMILLMVDRFGGVSGAAIRFEFGAWEMGTAYAMIGFLVLYWKEKRPAWCLAGLSMMLILLCIEIARNILMIKI